MSTHRASPLALAQRFIFMGVLTVISAGLGTTASALPLIDKIANTGGEAVKVYPDLDQPSKFWYIPVSVEPWTRNEKYKSQLYVANDKSSLTFMFRGQASVDEETLTNVAKALNVPKANLSPIAYDKTQNLTCENVFVGEKIQWSWPPKMGGYLEVVPIAIRTTDSKLVPTLENLITGNGLNCFVEYSFRGVYSAYWIKIKANLNSVYDRFKAEAHAEGLWWEVDISTFLEKLEKDGTIHIEKVEDPSAPKTPLDDQVLAATDNILKKFVAEIFTPVLKLPTGDIVGRGKPWSLRVKYDHSEENKRFGFNLHSQQVASKESLITIRMALGGSNLLEILTAPPTLQFQPMTNKEHNALKKRQ